MERNFENPFADYGAIVHRDRFIGRREDLKIVENRIICPSEPGNLAVIGDSRIGKSSLIYKAIIDRKDDLITKKFLPIWINLSIHNNVYDFFSSLVKECVDELEDLDWLSDSLRQAADRALQNTLSWNEKYYRIQRFFQKVRKNGIKILFILDEFDHARTLFKENISAFQYLRELSYRPEWRICFVITARRTIRDIELQTQAISTFDGIFYKHYLGMFDPASIEEYFARLISVGLPASQELRQQVNYYCGGHPYLLDMLGYEIVEIFREKQKIDVELAFQRVSRSFLDQYDRMITLLQEENSLDKLLQIVFGPVVDVKRTDVETLLKYGFIQQTEKGSYTTFSKYFYTYLKIIEREVELDLWPVWCETEKALRQFIERKMKEKYGNNWINQFIKSRPHLKQIFEKCRALQEREERSFGTRASKNLLDFTYPQDLFEIIFAEWTCFKDIFKKDKNYWKQRSSMLAKIRNPLAHNRNKILQDYELQIAEGYCKEILDIIKSA